jgi:hypothetical protein
MGRSLPLRSSTSAGSGQRDHTKGPTSDPLQQGWVQRWQRPRLLQRMHDPLRDSHRPLTLSVLLTNDDRTASEPSLRPRRTIGKRHTGSGPDGAVPRPGGFVGRRPTYFLSSPPPTQARIAATSWGLSPIRAHSAPRRCPTRVPPGWDTASPWILAARATVVASSWDFHSKLPVRTQRCFTLLRFSEPNQPSGDSDAAAASATVTAAS